MILNVQTVFWMDAFLYLTLHVAIWYGLARYRSPVVVLWGVSGILSALGLCVLGSRGWLSTDTMVVAGQFLMVAGNWGRQMALRSIDGPPELHWLWTSAAMNLGFLGLSYGLYFSGHPESTITLLFYAYFSLNCIEYILVGRRIGAKLDTIGATSVQWAGLVLAASLGGKIVAMMVGEGATDQYAVSWDQGLVFIGQFVAMILLCVGFMQIFIDKDHRQRIVVEQQLARQQERAALALQHTQDLGVLLSEREEIIRQLTLSNKSAGMGALVASFAHELNQPLTATLMHAELIQTQLSAAMSQHKPPNLELLSTVAESVINDTQRAADIIRKLRNLFRMSKGEYVRMDFDQLVLDVLDLVRPKLHEAGIVLSLEIEPSFRLNGDATQLQQVVLNLLNNAIDAIIDGRTRFPRLKIRGQRSGDFLMLEIEDNGKGILREHYDDVFSLFKTSKTHGMGVGLWLSRSIVEMHGGQLGFESDPDRSTVFRLRLPFLDKTLLG